MEKDVDKNGSEKQPPTIDTTNVPPSPIVIKIETPMDPVKKPTDADDNTKKTQSRCCQLLPVLLFLATFASVLSLLIFYMDPSTEYRHQQFRQNLTHDYNMVNTPQDSDELVWFVREVMKKYPMPNLQRLPMDQYNFTTSDDEAPKMARFIGEQLLGGKKSGFYFQSLTGTNGQMMPAPWLTESLEWGGCIVEPDPRKYFNYRKSYAQRDATKIVHASLSPQKYPKEVTLHYEEDESEVKVERMTDEPERIKCFPLYTILLALNRTNIDLLSLGCQGQELEILQTIPWDRVTVDVISIHLVHYSHKIDYYLYTSDLIKYIEDLSYRLVWNHERNFIFQKSPIAIN